MWTGVGTVQVSWLREEGEKKGNRESLERFRRAAPLPVLQFSRHPLGEAAADQTHQEEHTHAERDHQQDVVLGRGGHHLHRQV